MSLYFEKSAKIVYKGDQEDYSRKSLSAVNKTVRIIRAPGEEPFELFERIINYWAEKRHKIARFHGTPEAEQFGLRRDTHRIESVSSLSERYSAYGGRFASQINEYLEEAKRELHAWNLGPFRKTLPICLEKNSFLDLVLIGPEHQEAIFPCRTIQDFQYMYQLCKKELPQYFLREGELYFKRHDAIEELFQDDKAIQELFQRSFHEYQKLRNTLSLLCAQKRENISCFANWVLVNHYMEVDQQMILISQILLQTPSQAFKESEIFCFHPTIIHQDPLILNTSLFEMSRLFQQAIHWNKETASRDQLKQTVALLIYEWSHATPFLRGSAAAGEWLERAIYNHHGFAHEYNHQNPPTSKP